MVKFQAQRKSFHERICSKIVHRKVKEFGKKKIAINVPSFSDIGSQTSALIGSKFFDSLQCGNTLTDSIDGQSAGKLLEEEVLLFIESCFQELQHIRPGTWGIGRQEQLAKFEQFEHLSILHGMVKDSPALAATLGSDYVIKPDVVVWREPETDDAINANEPLVDDSVASNTPLRLTNQANPILHASISCKWSIRSDRSQNSRTEALNLVRNRKGHLPHIMVVTAEPLPSRIASIALGTGDIDCTYHIGLPELVNGVQQTPYEDALELLQNMIAGKRLRDISDLPLDLAL